MHIGKESRAALFLLLAAACLPAAVPAPADHLGFKPGDEDKLANYGEILSYFQKLEQASDRIRLVEFGRSSENRPMYAAFISAPENLRRLEHYKDINRRLALGLASPEEAKRLAAEGKAFVWIDSGLHASEVAPAQHSPELAWRTLTGEDDETRRIRQNVVLIQVPVINPDGLDWLVAWYRSNLGTPHELAAMPRLYQKYAGHDNNRDYFMLNLAETRHVTRMLFREWFPQIVYNQHQQPAFPARIFVPPYAEPLNPNIPAPVMEGINLIGSAMKERFARESKPGVLSYFGFDAWWNGGLRSVPAFHNMHGILTETAAFQYAKARVYGRSDIPERFANGIPAREPTVFYQRPWMGGRWSVREAIEYMLTADFAILELASSRSAQMLFKAWEMAREAVETGRKGKPFAYIVPQEQWDASSAGEMLWRLGQSGVEIRRARGSFTAAGKSYPAGSVVLPAAQPFRAYLVDLMEPQRYPEIRTGAGGPIKRPYDIAGWTLPLQMGVAVDRVDDPFEADLAPEAAAQPPAPVADFRQNSAFQAVAAMLAEGRKVRRAGDGQFLVEGRAPAEDFAKARWEVRRPRVALYEPWSANMDAGWTQWLLDYYRVPHTLVHNPDFQESALSSRFDTVVFASQSAASILHGIRPGERPGGNNPSPLALQRPEYTGGIGLAGAVRLEAFVREGGTLLAFDSATELPLQYFPLPVRNALRPPPAAGRDEPPPASGYYCPGSLLRIQVDTANPVAFGMPAEGIAFNSGGQVFESTLLKEFNTGEREVKTVSSYVSRNLLASGWISGERAIAGKAVVVEARYGKGRVILYGFRPQHRGQPFGTFKLVLNAIYQASARPL